ncbi:MAG: methyltransferase domain-containing protein, partial [Bacteroidota bacterium]
MTTEDVNDSRYWEGLYESNQHRWDLRSPNPVFVDLLGRNALPPGGRVIVPGSGTGHDAILFATHGYDVTAVDFSETAIRFSRDAAVAANASVVWHKGDFFHLPKEWKGSFDLLVEYVTFCAIDPARRS